MSGVKLLVRVTLGRLGFANEIYHLVKQQKIPQVVSPDEVECLLAMAKTQKAHILLSLAYGRGFITIYLCGTKDVSDGVDAPLGTQMCHSSCVIKRKHRRRL
jgi:hypothetical protein